MKIPRFAVGLSLFAWFLAGCAGVGVVATADPKAKLADATRLFDQQDRPLLAEQLIREALDACGQSADPACLADAYRTYGFFFRAASVGGNSRQHYQESGFLDRSATFDTRYAKSVEYFQRSREIYARLERFDALTNIDLNMGFSYELMGDKAQACQAFAASAADHRENMRRNPGVEVALPQGVASFDDFLVPHRRRAGCQ